MSSKVSRDILYEVVREVLPGKQPEVFGDGGASDQPETVTLRRTDASWALSDSSPLPAPGSPCILGDSSTAMRPELWTCPHGHRGAEENQQE